MLEILKIPLGKIKFSWVILAAILNFVRLQLSIIASILVVRKRGGNIARGI